MKKILFYAAIAAMCLTACSTEDPEEANVSLRIKADTSPVKELVTITFKCQGYDITTSDFGTRAELKADGKAMTDLWVLDYMDGSLAQSVIHQTSDQEDFGTPTLNLAVGSHHVYFIASRGKTPTLNTGAGTITFGTATIADVPLKQNRITTFSGPLFSANGLTTVSLSTDWQTEYEGTW